MRRYLIHIAARRRKSMYIHEKDKWTEFRWDDKKIALALDHASRKQGKLYGKLSCLGFDGQLSTMAENLTHDMVHSSEIEGIRLNMDEVRSSIARRLGIDNKKSIPSSHYIDGVVSVMIDATEHYDQPLSKERLCGWQAAFFPTGFSGGEKIEVGQYRTHEEHIVSGVLGRERVHYVAPSPERVEHEMENFIDWYNSEQPISPIIRSAIAHFWFVSIHPFEDGNGRLSRILGDVFLSRGDQSSMRFYNISSEINRDKKHYYEILERAQHGDGDLTEWLCWYIEKLSNALDEANILVRNVLNKSIFWRHAASTPLSKRQIDTLNLFLDGYEAKLTSKIWSELNKCSKDTANRDIQDLVQKNILREEIPGAKRPSYSIVYSDTQTLNNDFSDIKITSQNNDFYLTARYKGVTNVRERILRLDAERFERNDITLENLLAKYCRYLMGE